LLKTEAVEREDDLFAKMADLRITAQWTEGIQAVGCRSCRAGTLEGDIDAKAIGFVFDNFQQILLVDVHDSFCSQLLRDDQSFGIRRCSGDYCLDTLGHEQL
jgi:hypothetical protein